MVDGVFAPAASQSCMVQKVWARVAVLEILSDDFDRQGWSVAAMSLMRGICILPVKGAWVKAGGKR